MRVLLIEDDEDCRHLFAPFLESIGFTVHTSTTGEEGLRKFDWQRPDIVIVDAILPGLNGWEVCRRIRMVSDIPVLMITGLAREKDDLLRGFQCGADLYLEKPIDLDILKMHVLRMLMRRGGEQDVHGVIYADGHLTVDSRRQQVWVNGKRIRLSRTEYRLLEVLVYSQGQDVPMIEIIEEVWGQRAEGKQPSSLTQ